MDLIAGSLYYVCTVCRYNFPQSSRCDVCGEWAFQIAAQRRRKTRTKHTSNESCWEQCSCTLWIVTWLQSNITCIMWLKLTWNIFFLLCLSPLNMSLFPAEPRCPKFEVNQINTYVLHSIGNSPSDLKPVEWELGTRTLCSTYTHGHTHLKHEKLIMKLTGRLISATFYSLKLKPVEWGLGTHTLV